VETNKKVVLPELSTTKFAKRTFSCKGIWESILSKYAHKENITFCP